MNHSFIPPRCASIRESLNSYSYEPGFIRIDCGSCYLSHCRLRCFLLFTRLFFSVALLYILFRLGDEEQDL